MIGFACPWCDHEVALSPQSFAAEAIVCGDCSTRIELSVGPAIAPVVVEIPRAALPRAA